MSNLKPKVRQKCECGRTVEAGSVFCSECKASIERKNTRIIGREVASFNKKYLIHS